MSTAARKLIVKTPKPRNPCAVAGRQRRAGSHRSGPGAVRQQARQSLRREVHQFQQSP